MRVVNVAVIMALAASAGCAMTPSGTWTGNVQPRAGSNVDANVQASTATGTTIVAINMIGGEPGGQHPWHIHYGTCATGGDIVGDPESYPMLEPDQAGRATAEARVRLQLMPDLDYHVNVHRSTRALGEVIGCGNLRMN